MYAECFYESRKRSNRDRDFGLIKKAMKGETLLVTSSHSLPSFSNGKKKKERKTTEVGVDEHGLVLESWKPTQYDKIT